MLGAAEQIDEDTGSPGWSYARAVLAEYVTPIASRADEPEIAAALAAGRAMSESDAAAYALATVAQETTRV